MTTETDTPVAAERYNLLSEPLFTVVPAGGQKLTLPDLVARLLAGPEIEGFPNLAAEQRGPWWRFLVRCAAKVLRARGWSVAEASKMGVEHLSEEIRKEMDKLVPGGWLLFQSDWGRPGFLQTPVPDGKSPEGAGYARNSLALLTGAIGSKFHERKVGVDQTKGTVGVGRSRTPEQTVYALVEYQTVAVFGGSGNYQSQFGGSRGAGASTPFMSGAVAGSLGATFRHDVSVLLDSWDEIREEKGPRGKIWALWATPWDAGDAPLRIDRLDPAFIPLARRIRLAAPDADGNFGSVWFGATKQARVPKDREGNLGDPFTPLVPNPKKGGPSFKVRGAMPDGYDYREVVRLLFGTDKGGVPSPSVRALTTQGGVARPDLRVIFEGYGYQSNSTMRFFRREVPLPISGQNHLLRRAIADPNSPAANAVREVHSKMFALVDQAKRALTTALLLMAVGRTKEGRLPPRREKNSKKPGTHERVLRRAEEALEARVDAVYLNRLLRAAEERNNLPADAAPPHLQGYAEWGNELAALSRQGFEEFATALPRPNGRRWERQVEPRRVLDGFLARLKREAGGSRLPNLLQQGQNGT